ncbi:hypothetical protein CF109_20000, partial [Aeromonas veronii]
PRPRESPPWMTPKTIGRQRQEAPIARATNVSISEKHHRPWPPLHHLRTEYEICKMGSILHRMSGHL